MITDTFLWEKRQEILGLFSLERRQVCGGMRIACEPCSTDTPFLIQKKKKRMCRGEWTQGKRLPNAVCGSLWRDFKGNPIVLGRNLSL